MRKVTMLALAAAMAAMIPLEEYLRSGPVSDPLGNELRGYGFIPIKLPSTLMEVGSLYYIDANLSDFSAICSVTKADLDAVTEARAWNIQTNFTRRGAFDTNFRIDFSALISAEGKDNFVQKVYSSLSDVFVREMPLGADLGILLNIMKQPQCNRAAMAVLDAGGYVCQGQKILRADVEYKLDLDGQDKLATTFKAKVEEISNVVKTAIETQSNQSVIERSGRWYAGSALNFGVAMTPKCLTPPHAWFNRILPRTKFGQIVNFVLFRLIEPMLPVKNDDSQVAQNSITG